MGEQWVGSVVGVVEREIATATHAPQNIPVAGSILILDLIEPILVARGDDQVAVHRIVIKAILMQPVVGNSGDARGSDQEQSAAAVRFVRRVRSAGFTQCGGAVNV